MFSLNSKHQHNFTPDKYRSSKSSNNYLQEMESGTHHPASNSTPTPTSGYQPHYWADILLCAVYLLCLAVGVPGNLVAIKYFLREGRMTSYLFLSTAVVDLLALAVKSVPISVSLIFHRQPMFYSNDIACHVIGMFQNGTIMASVFIVAVLSSTRTYSLVFPLKIFRRRTVLVCMVVYFSVLVVHEVLPVLLNKLHFTYSSEDVICWDAGDWSTYDDLVDSLFLALPIIPITFCCIVSCHQVYFAPKNAISQSRLKSSATITIILYTVTYIIFNAPNFVNYVLWNITSIGYEWPGPHYSSLFMQYYSWNISGELCLVMNSAVNPLIYLLRIQRYRDWVREGGGQIGTRAPVQMSLIIFNEQSVRKGISRLDSRVDNTLSAPAPTLTAPVPTQTLTARKLYSTSSLAP